MEDVGMTMMMRKTKIIPSGPVSMFKIYWRYFRYLLWHKWCVYKACRRRGLIWRGITHDMSKFLPSEFISYARYFHGKWPSRKDVKTNVLHWGGHPDSLTSEGVREAWEYAFMKHVHRNEHHWQHWLFTNKKGQTKPLRIPVKAYLEMLSDWDGSGISITGNLDTYEWYTRNRKWIIMTPEMKEIGRASCRERV